MKIGMIVAMEKELAQLRALLGDAVVERHNHKDFISGTIGSHTVILQQCGIGKVNSAIGTVEMIDNYHPDLVVSTGCAGGADTSFNVMDVVASTECVYHDAWCGDNCEYGQIMGMPAVYRTPKELVAKAVETGAKHPELNIRAGQIVSGEWFVDSREKMKEILKHFPDAAAVDMESCSIAQTCLIYKTPFISFRIISDVPMKDDKAAQYFDFWNKMADGSFKVARSFLESL